MAETKSPDELTFLTKRKPDINGEDSQDHPNKAQKLETLDDNSLAPSDEAKNREASLNLNNSFEVPCSNCSSVTDGKVEKVESDVVADMGDDEDEEFDHGGVEDDGDEDNDGEESIKEAMVDRKGKAIMRADKGKGKLIEDDEDDDDSGDDDDDDDDSSDDGVVSDGDSDLSDDPLAEVDLNNILPSRTRRRTIHPGEYIANDLGNDDDNDDSDDSDM